MGFTLWNLFKAGLLIMNALALLHEWRFLHPMLGIGELPPDKKLTPEEERARQQEFHEERLSLPSWKRQVDDILRTSRTLRFPLAFVNTVVIVIELLMGG